LLEIWEDFQHDQLVFKNGKIMELDIFLPKENLALEFQGEQHYHDIYGVGTCIDRSQRDREKILACRNIGISLVEVPYWWDFQKPSLIATIQSIRKDLLTDMRTGKPIPMELTATSSTGDLRPW
jgi:hypothetical protein